MRPLHYHRSEVDGRRKPSKRLDPGRGGTPQDICRAHQSRIYSLILWMGHGIFSMAVKRLFPDRPCRDGPIAMFPSSSVDPDSQPKGSSFANQAPGCNATMLSTPHYLLRWPSPRRLKNCLLTKSRLHLRPQWTIHSGLSQIERLLHVCLLRRHAASFALGRSDLVKSPHLRRFDPSSFSIFLRSYPVSPHLCHHRTLPHRVKCFWASHARAGRVG